MGLLSKLGSAISGISEGISWGIKKVGDWTQEVCESVATTVQDWGHKAKNKIEEWENKLFPKSEPTQDPVHPSAKKADKPLVAASNDYIKEYYPAGVMTTALNTTAEERIKSIAELVPQVADIMGIKNPPEVEIFIPDNIEQMHSLCGGYKVSDNTLSLNGAMIVSDEPELFREQVSTVFHELIHARQWEAVLAWAKGESIEEYGYSTEYIKILAENLTHYIRSEENYEAYTKQPCESEAFWFEDQIKPYFN